MAEFVTPVMVKDYLQATGNRPVEHGPDRVEHRRCFG